MYLWRLDFCTEFGKHKNFVANVEETWQPFQKVKGRSPLQICRDRLGWTALKILLPSLWCVPDLPLDCWVKQKWVKELAALPSMEYPKKFSLVIRPGRTVYRLVGQGFNNACCRCAEVGGVNDRCRARECRLALHEGGQGSHGVHGLPCYAH